MAFGLSMPQKRRWAGTTSWFKAFWDSSGSILSTEGLCCNEIQGILDPCVAGVFVWTAFLGPISHALWPLLAPSFLTSHFITSSPHHLITTGNYITADKETGWRNAAIP
ncbi:hypothetical protein B0O80DRAFT_427564 [Mortierella sp. GBAus27b]|nr:hypothetical protein B0O80DRAFT_427564 [Mortierella sp. GBAus27b]